MQYIPGNMLYPACLSTDMCLYSIDNYVLQVTGEETYIAGDVRLLEFKAVRRYLRQNY